MRPKKKSHLFTILSLFLALTIFCAFTLMGISYYHTISKSNEQYFEQQVKQAEEYILKRYYLYDQALRGGLGLFYASNYVSRQEWKSYVETLDIEKKLPGVNGIGFIRNVRHSELDDFIEEKNKYHRNFSNHPITEFSDKFIIEYIVPENKNIEAIGLDIGFESDRRHAAEISRDTGRSALTRKIQLVQDSSKNPGFLLLMPFYKGTDDENITIEERRKNIVGWVYAPFIGKNFFYNIPYIENNNLSFTVYDGAYLTPENEIYRHSNEDYKARYTSIKTISIADHTWTLVWKDTQEYIAASNTNFSYLIVFIGCIISIFSYLFLSLLTNTNNRISQEIADQTHKLTQSENFLKLMMDTIPDLIFVKNKNLEIIRANEAFLNMFPPEKRDKVIGTTGIESFDKAEAEIFIEQDRIAFETGLTQTYENLSLFNGKELNIFTTKVKFSSDNNEDYILAIGRDISDLLQTQKELEKKVEERTKEYKEQKTIAEKAAKSKEDFLANMSHELRTPLNSIIGLTKILIDEGDFNNEHSEALGIIENASTTLLNTVNDVLDISKIEAGKMKLESKDFNLSATVHTIVEQIKPLAQKKNLDLHENIDDLGELYVRADEYRISKIITNLLSNAVQYTENGHVSISLHSEEIDNDKADFIICVSDTGIGIPKEKQNTIFDQFSQVEKTKKDSSKGTGLGLSITKKLVDLMKGFISLDSEIGIGSTFTVRIPLLKSSKEAVDQASQALTTNFIPKNQKEKLHISKAKILVAEDHEFNNVFIQKLLRRIGNDNFLILSNGSLILEEFKKNEYDIILMDCHMPVLDGYETTTKIRQHEKRIEKEHITPIVAMTADIMPGTEKKCLKVGMNDYLSKPIDENKLKEIMQRWFNLYRHKDKTTTTKSQNISKDETKSIDLSILDGYTNNLEDKRNLINIFYSKSAEDLKILEKNCTTGENIEWVQCAHSLKGSAGYIGAKSLKNICSVAQSMSDSTSEERLDVYKKIRNEYQKVCHALILEGFLERRKRA